MGYPKFGKTIEDMTADMEGYVQSHGRFTISKDDYSVCVVQAEAKEETKDA